MFWDNLCVACHNKKITPTALSKELSISSSSVTAWKQGRIPNGETLIKIANYLQVSIDYLLGRTDEPNNNSIQTGDISNTIQGDNNNNHVNIGNAKNITEEAVQEISSILSGLTPRQRTELMMIIYQFADEHTV